MTARLVLLIAATVGVYLWLRGLVRGMRASGPSPQGQPGSAAGGPMVRDRICNTFLPRARALVEKSDRGEQFFCSERCRRRFLEQREAPRADAAP